MPPNTTLDNNIQAVRVAIVNSSVVIRGIFSRWLSENSNIEVLGSFRSEKELQEILPKLRPDVILFELEKIEKDFFLFLSRVISAYPEIKIVLIAKISEKGEELRLKALSRGAAKCIFRPTQIKNAKSVQEFRDELIEKIIEIRKNNINTHYKSSNKTMFERKSTFSPSNTSSSINLAVPEKRKDNLRPLERCRPKIIVIGASTGGPQALTSVLEKMKSACNQVPVIIAQHMSPAFLKIFLSHLQSYASLPVSEIEHDAPLIAGKIYLAPGGSHTIIKKKSNAGLVSLILPPEAQKPWRPSIDLLFSSAAASLGSEVLAIALTGMGRDGTEGAKDLIKNGANVIVQDEISSVVWGIPGSIVEAELACAILPPEKLGELAAMLLEGKFT